MLDKVDLPSRFLTPPTRPEQRERPESGRPCTVQNSRTVQSSPSVQSCTTLADDQIKSTAYPWVVPHERQRQDISQFPYLSSWFERIQNRPSTQKAYEIAKSINTAPTVDQNAKSILFGQDAKTVV